MPYLNASEVAFHEEALDQVTFYLLLILIQKYQWFIQI